MNERQVIDAIPVVLRHGRIKEYPELYRLFSQQEFSLLADHLAWQGKLFQKLHRSVSVELHRAKMFTRLCVSKKKILYTSLSFVHDIGDWICEYFVERFPDCVILISDGRYTFVGKMFDDSISITRESAPLEEIKFSLEQNLDSEFGFSTSFNKKVWEDFYQGQYIESRKNLRYFSQSIPKKMISQFSLDIEQQMVSGNDSLLKFI